MRFGGRGGGFEVRGRGTGRYEVMRFGGRGGGYEVTRIRGQEVIRFVGREVMRLR